MPIWEDDEEITYEDFLEQQIAFNRKVERLKKMRAEQKAKDLEWLEESWNAETD